MTKKIYICSKIADYWLLRIFKINHLFILDPSNNLKYEIDVPRNSKGLIRIIVRKVNPIRILRNKNINYKLVKVPVKTFYKKLNLARKIFEFKPYRLFWRNCWVFVKFFYPIKISLRGYLE